MPELKEGDVVILKATSGPKMVVAAVNLVSCVWLNESTGQFFNYILPAESLKNITTQGTLLDMNEAKRGSGQDS